MSILATDPVMASKPVASTSASTWYSLPPVRTAFGRDLLDRIGLDVDQCHVRTVEGRKILGVDADAFGADRMSVRLQQLCGLGILDDLADLFADEIGGGIVGRLLEPEIVVDRHESEPAAAPARLVFGAALVVAVIERAAVGHFGIDAVTRLDAGEVPDFRIFGTERLPFLFGQRGVAGRNREIRGALEYREMARLLGNHRHRLDPRRSRADHADALAGEIDRLVRPMSGVIDLALEAIEALDLGHPRVRQAAGGEHDEFRGHDLAVGQS